LPPVCSYVTADDDPLLCRLFPETAIQQNAEQFFHELERRNNLSQKWQTSEAGNAAICDSILFQRAG
jgi:hypothetical protein